MQFVSEPINLLSELDHIQLCVHRTQFRLVSLADLHRIQHALVRRGRCIKHAFHTTALPLFALEFDNRDEVVAVEPMQAIELVESLDLGLGLVTRIAHPAPRHRPIFLRDLGIVILASHAPTPKSELFIAAITQELIVDELGTMVRINAA